MHIVLCQKGSVSYLPERKMSFFPPSFKDNKTTVMNLSDIHNYKFLTHFKLLASLCQNLCYVGRKWESERKQQLSRSEASAATGFPKVPSKLGNKSSNSPIYIIRFCANSSVPHHKNGTYIKKRGTSVGENNAAKNIRCSRYDMHFMIMMIKHCTTNK